MISGSTMTVCDHNITRQGRTHRMRLGILMFAVGMALAAVVVKLELASGFRALAFFPFMAGSLAIAQAAQRTCVMRAVKGQRETSEGVERIRNPEQLEADRIRARRVFRVAAAAAVLATGMLYLVP